MPSLKISKKNSRQKVEKKKILVWSDSVLAPTGYATVSRHIMKALHDTGKYEIDQLAINHYYTFYDRKEYPYQIVSAKGRSGDPHGRQLFVDTIKSGVYDIILVINDVSVTSEVGDGMDKIYDIIQKRNRKIPYLIYYYPVDCMVIPEDAGMIRAADRAVAYTEFAKKETEMAGLKVTDVIYHGADTKAFIKTSQQNKDTLRRQLFKIEDPKTFLWINVNRNSLRKDVAKTIFAFAEFKKKVTDNTKLYLHMASKDSSSGLILDLKPLIRRLGLTLNYDVLFPSYNMNIGVSIPILNQLYNCADAYISTHLGEGWGLSVGDAMACGLPCVLPDNTVTPEVTDGGKNAYVYPCKEWCFIETSGPRKLGRLEDIVSSMEDLYTDWKEEKQGKKTKMTDKILKSTEFVNKHSWSNIVKKWVTLFGSLPNKKEIKKEMASVESM